MSQTGNPIKAKLTEHPRVVGVLFAVALLVANVGTVVAANGGGNVGP